MRDRRLLLLIRQNIGREPLRQLRRELRRGEAAGEKTHRASTIASGTGPTMGCMGLQRRRVSRSTFETWRMRSARGPLPRGRRGCGGSRDDAWVLAAAHFHFFLARSLLVAPFGGQYTRRTGTDISNQVEVADSTKKRAESRDTDDLRSVLGCLLLSTGGGCVLEVQTYARASVLLES